MTQDCRQAECVDVIFFSFLFVICNGVVVRLERRGGQTPKGMLPKAEATQVTLLKYSCSKRGAFSLLMARAMPIE